MASTMNQDELLEVVAEILEVEPGTVTLADRLGDIDWDSLSNISFIAEIDTRLGAMLDADELASAETVQDLFELVTRSVGSA